MAALQPAALLRRQQRPARLHQLQRRVHRIRVLRLPARPRRRARAGAAATRTTRGRTSRTASRCSPRTTSRSRTNLTLNLGLRWAYTSPLVEKDDRQSNFDLSPASRSLPRTAASRTARSTSPTTRASSRGSAPPGAQPTTGVPRRLRHLAVHGGHGRQPAPAAQSAVLLRVGRRPTTRTTGAGSAAQRLRRPGAGTTPTGNVRAYDPNLRPQFTHQWNAFAEYRLTPAHVGAGRLRRTPRRPPGDAGRGQPGAARRRRSRDLGAEDHAPAALWRAAARHHHRDDGRAVGQQVQLDAGERAPAPATGVEFLASYTLGERHDEQPRLLRRVWRHRSAGRDERAPKGAYWQNTYDPEAEWGPVFHDVRHNLIFSAHLRAAVRQGPHRAASDWSGVTDALLGGWRLGGIFQARSGLPITVIDGRARSLQGERGSERPNCVGDWKPADQSHQLAGSTSTASRRRRSARSATARWASRARPATRTSIWCCRSVRRRRSALRRVPNRGVQRPQPPELRPAGARHLGAEHLRDHHQHDQRAARGRAGAEVLLLSPSLRSRS